MTEVKKEKFNTIAKYILLFCFISFFGWAWETLYRLVRSHELVDRGFLTTPICPIYGTTIFLIYFLIGTPEEGRGFLKKVDNPKHLQIYYLILAMVIPTVMELGVGFFFDKCFGLRLWNYTSLPLNIGGYVCLPISLFWGIGITLVMRFVFPKIKEIFFKINNKVAVILSICLVSIISLDSVLCFLNVILK